MNFDDVILNRRSIRKYLDEDISVDDLYKIVEFGIYAPSAHNRQPWKVKIVKGDEKSLISEALKGKAGSDYSIINTARIIKEAPALLVIFYDESDGNRDGDILSIGAFIENMHLKCTEMGFGSLWIAHTNFIKDEISKITGVSLDCVSCLAVGKTLEKPKMRPRKNIEEIIVK